MSPKAPAEETKKQDEPCADDQPEREEAETPRRLTPEERAALEKEMDVEARYKIASLPEWGPPALARPGLELVPSDDALFGRGREERALGLGIDSGVIGRAKSSEWGGEGRGEEYGEGNDGNAPLLPRVADVEVEDDVADTIQRADTMPYVLNRDDVIRAMEQRPQFAAQSSFVMPGAHRYLDHDRKYVRSQGGGTGGAIVAIRDDNDMYHTPLDVDFHKSVLDQWNKGQDIRSRLDALAVEKPQGLHPPPGLERNLSFQDNLNAYGSDDLRVPDKYVVRGRYGRIDREAFLREIELGTRANVRHPGAGEQSTASSSKRGGRSTGGGSNAGSTGIRSVPNRSSSHDHHWDGGLQPSPSRYDDELDDVSQSESFAEFIRSKTFEKEQEREREQREAAELAAATREMEVNEAREPPPKSDAKQEAGGRGRNAFIRNRRFRVRSLSRSRKPNSKNTVTLTGDVEESGFGRTSTDPTDPQMMMVE